MASDGSGGGCRRSAHSAPKARRLHWLAGLCAAVALLSLAADLTAEALPGSYALLGAPARDGNAAGTHSPADELPDHGALLVMARVLGPMAAITVLALAGQACSAWSSAPPVPPP